MFILKEPIFQLLLISRSLSKSTSVLTIFYIGSSGGKTPFEIDI